MGDKEDSVGCLPNLWNNSDTHITDKLMLFLKYLEETLKEQKKRK